MGHKKTKLNICHHMLRSSIQLQNRSFHVVERTRTSTKCQKMKYARAKRAKRLFFTVKYANLWGFCCRRRRGCFSSLKIDCRNAKLHFQMTFSLPSPSCLLKLPSASFGRLHHRLWSDHGIHLSTKFGVYRTVVLTTLLYGSESWTWYRRHVKKLDHFLLRCLRQICGISWKDNTKHYCT